MNIYEAIEWADNKSLDGIKYFIRPWNNEYIVFSEIEYNRNPDVIIVYNTVDKELDHDIVYLNSLDFKNRKVKEEVLSRKLISPTYVCFRTYNGSPKMGEILKPYYETCNKVYYKFTDSDGNEIKYDYSRMTRLGAYFKTYSVENSIAIGDDYIIIVDGEEILDKPPTRKDKLMGRVRNKK